MTIQTHRIPHCDWGFVRVIKAYRRLSIERVISYFGMGKTKIMHFLLDKSGCNCVLRHGVRFLNSFVTPSEWLVCLATTDKPKAECGILCV